MQTFFAQIRAAMEADLYYLALSSALMLPDICGAMASANGWATDQKYIDWFDHYVGARYSGAAPFDGQDCYHFRCAMLHLGSSQRPKARYGRILFLEPSIEVRGAVFHRNIIDDAYNIDVRIFVNDMIEGAEQWLVEAEPTPEYQQNYPKFVQRYPTGLHPYVDGLPVIS